VKRDVYNLVLYKEPYDDSWSVLIKEYPGCVSAGQYPDEALALVVDAIEAGEYAEDVDDTPLD
jgi:predicted RNase H-like HicB family nuclease